MDLFENPFYLLEVTTRDPSQKIVLAAEEKSLLLDPDVCTKARTTLINPRQRLSAEVSWLPGMAPGKAIELIQKISTSPNEVTNALSMLPPLVQCNLSTSLIERLSFKDNTAHLEKWILYIANSFENIDAGGLLALLNEDRTVARFPSIPKIEDVEQELNSHKNYLVEVLKNALNSIPDPDVLLTEVLEQAMQNGAPVPLLLDDLTELYRIEVQKYLDQLADETGQMINSLKNDLNAANGIIPTLYKRIGRLEETLKTWAQIAKPISLAMQDRGSQDEHGLQLANQIRDLAIFLASEHGLYAEARLITCLMREIFENFPYVTDRINDDLETLVDILGLDIELGGPESLIQLGLSRYFNINYRKRLTINTNYISYDGASISVAKIIHVGWSYNETDRVFNILLKIPDKYLQIVCFTPDQLKIIIDKIWKITFKRLIYDALHELSQGKRLEFYNVFIDRNGIWLKKEKFIGTKPYHAHWEEITIRKESGYLAIESTKEYKAHAEVPQKNTFNYLILEEVIRYLVKDANYLKLQQGFFS